MNDIAHNTSPDTAAPNPVMAAFSRPAALIGGAAALILATAFATTMVVRGSGNSVQTGNDKAAGAMALSPLALVNSDGKSGVPGVPQAPMDAPERDANKLPTITEKAEPQSAPKPANQGSAAPARQATTKTATTAAVCSTCGVVQSVTPVKQKGEATGVGAVGGAVVGGLIGNQMGGGSGKKAMTVIGAVGGGAAGHEIEKRARGTTVYRVSVRMNDGSVRTVTQNTPPVVGQKVTVSGGQVRARA
jgi:outer membrane lipoprotein SlyB